MDHKTLALVMVVKNEEKGLEKAILSCKDFVDEIIIAVDNSSNDNTLQVAKQYATTLKTFDWCDDFAWARNFAHEGVKTDWILFLDGHEYVAKYDNLQEFLNTDHDGLLCTVELDTGACIRNPRIYKNGCVFEGAVHEKQNCKSVIFYPGFLVKHDRIHGQSAKAILERDQQRDDQVPRIMGKMLKENPRNIRALFHLALYYQSTGEFKKAIHYQNIYFKYSKLRPERWFVFFNRALCLMAIGKNFSAFVSACRADSETPGRWEIDKLKGLIYFQKRQYMKCAEYIVKSFRINTCDQSYKPWAQDDGSSWNIIGECFFHLKEFYKAYVAFDKAKELFKDDQSKELAGKRAQLMFVMSQNSK